MISGSFDVLFRMAQDAPEVLIQLLLNRYMYIHNFFHVVLVRIRLFGYKVRIAKVSSKFSKVPLTIGA